MSNLKRSFQRDELIEQNPNYKALKSVDGDIVGYNCIECGRLHTAPHKENCSLDPESNVKTFSVIGTNNGGPSGMAVSLEDYERLEAENTQLRIAATYPLSGWQKAKADSEVRRAEGLFNDNCTLKAENARLKRDAIRLNLLEEHLDSLTVYRDLSKGTSVNIEWCYPTTGCPGEHKSDSIRDAIDKMEEALAALPEMSQS